MFMVWTILRVDDIDCIGAFTYMLHAFGGKVRNLSYPHNIVCLHLFRMCNEPSALREGVIIYKHTSHSSNIKGLKQCGSWMLLCELVFSNKH